MGAGCVSSKPRKNRRSNKMAAERAAIINECVGKPDLLTSAELILIMRQNNTDSFSCSPVYLLLAHLWSQKHLQGLMEENWL